jgi:hypothetical protein
MCIIIDANMVGVVFAEPIRDDYRPIFDWILKRDGRLVYGGKLAGELERSEKFKRAIKTWGESGKAVRKSDDEIRRQEKLLKGKTRSNDPHVLALARISNARILCTNDDNLIADFKDRRIVPGSGERRGKVYRNASHQRLLKHHSGCEPE